MDSDDYKRSRLGAGSTANTNGQATTPNNNGSGDRQQQLTAGTSSGGGSSTMDSLKPEMTPQQQPHRSLASEDIWEWLKLSPMVPFSSSGRCCYYCCNGCHHFPFHFLFCYVFRDVPRLVLVMLSVCWAPTTGDDSLVVGREFTWTIAPTSRHRQRIQLKLLLHRY